MACLWEEKGYKVGKCVRSDQWPRAGISCAPHLNVGVKEETPEIPGDPGRTQACRKHSDCGFQTPTAAAAAAAATGMRVWNRNVLTLQTDISPC